MRLIHTLNSAEKTNGKPNIAKSRKIRVKKSSLKMSTLSIKKEAIARNIIFY